MTDNMSRAELVLNGKMSIIDYICKIAATDDEERHPNDLIYWETVRDAHKNGKKLIVTNGPVPAEILYALDCVPLSLDLIPTRLSQDEVLTTKLINDAETRANCALCSLHKTNLGALLSKNLGVTPDAYVTVPIPCDSDRTACTETARYIEAPSFNFDIPLRRDERGIRYIEMQFDRFVGFIEDLSGKKLDWDKVKYRMGLYNLSAQLLKRCAEFRTNRPCPMSSRMTVWNELMNAFGPTEEMGRLIESEIEICKKRIASGESPCPNGEEHRMLLMHNLWRQGIDITDWLEKEYSSVTVADGYCFDERELFDLDNKTTCINLMCRRMLSGSMAHGAGVSGEELLKSIEKLISSYAPDVFIFLGNRGCRHVWAATKQVSDVIQERYRASMLMLDIDNIDFRYKSEKEIRTLISEYMDTVVNKK